MNSLFNIWFSECLFLLNRNVNRYNCRYCSHQHPQKLKVRFRIYGNCVVGPFFYQEISQEFTCNCLKTFSILQCHILELLQLELVDISTIWSTKLFLFVSIWMQLSLLHVSSKVERPASSPVLSRLDYLWNISSSRWFSSTDYWWMSTNFTWISTILRTNIPKVIS